MFTLHKINFESVFDYLTSSVRAKLTRLFMLLFLSSTCAKFQVKISAQ